MKCYHSTTKERLISILKNGLRVNSKPNFFSSPTPYIMLSNKPLYNLNGILTVVLEINDPTIIEEYFDNDEGLRWPYDIAARYIKILNNFIKN